MAISRSTGPLKARDGTIWTIGHSTRSLDEFLELLAHYHVETVADVRRYPGSRRHPHFAEPTLGAALSGHGIGYRWIPLLGGRRRPSLNSPNTGWRNASFRGYADYMRTDDFAIGLNALIEISERSRTVVMCAEAVWWRCHRALIADVLRMRGFEVLHILDGAHAIAHPFTSPARIVEGRLTYGADATRG